MFLSFSSSFSFIFGGWFNLTFIWILIFWFFTVRLNIWFVITTVGNMIVTELSIHIFFTWWNMLFFYWIIVFYYRLIFFNLRCRHTSKVFRVNIARWGFFSTLVKILSFFEDFKILFKLIKLIFILFVWSIFNWNPCPTDLNVFLFFFFSLFLFLLILFYTLFDSIFFAHWIFLIIIYRIVHLFFILLINIWSQNRLFFLILFLLLLFFFFFFFFLFFLFCYNRSCCCKNCLVFLFLLFLLFFKSFLFFFLLCKPFFFFVFFWFLLWHGHYHCLISTICCWNVKFILCSSLLAHFTYILWAFLSTLL